MNVNMISVHNSISLFCQVAFSPFAFFGKEHACIQSALCNNGIAQRSIIFDVFSRVVVVVIVNIIYFTRNRVIKIGKCETLSITRKHTDCKRKWSQKMPNVYFDG